MSDTLESGGGDAEFAARQQTQPPAQEPTSAVDRAAALAEGPPGIPARFVWFVLAGALVLSLGGLLGEHLFTEAGLNPTPTTTTTTVLNLTQPVPQDTPVPSVPDRSIGAPLPSFMGLVSPSPRLVAPFVLSDQNGRRFSVPVQPPKVVVLSFFNAPCDDICPVLASEFEQADMDLGARAADVEFVTVNTDPSALSQSAEVPALASGLGRLPNWHIVSGPLSSLNAIWKSYGISIAVNKKTGLEAHTDLMDFIDPQGFLRDQATPFADESTHDTYSLPASSESRWAEGIATYASRLIGQ